MTRDEAIKRAEEIGKGAIAMPFSRAEDGSWAEWGVTTKDNRIIPPADTLSFKGYQKRFIET